jgi:hypothetical protein
MTTKLVLSAPLPRVYEDTGNGRVVPLPAGGGPEPEAARIGGEFKVEELTRVSRETVRAAAYWMHGDAVCIGTSTVTGVCHFT